MSDRPLRIRGVVPFLIAAAWGSFLFSTGARAQAPAGPITLNSVSGQFVVTSSGQLSPLLHTVQFATNDDYIRLDPALLAVSAERFKTSVWGLLGMKPTDPWTGKIFLSLDPAKSADDTVSLTVGTFLNGWGCRVELPDVVTLPRYGRAMTAALLLEIACRQQTDRSRVPEIPAWLADGLSQIAYGRDVDKIILSLPSKTIGGLSESRLNKHERGIDPAKGARLILQNSPALTVDQLCWPNDEQVNGRDGGVYLASAQMFTTELLALPNGPQKMRDFLAKLPGYYNWQTAFFSAFADNFKHPLDLEKWWALRVVRISTRDPGPHWTGDVSSERLADLLTVPVEYRSSSNSMPEHMQVSLQAAVEHFSRDDRDTVLYDKLRDLRVAQLRMSQPFGGLAGGYASALADFLGEGHDPVMTVANKHVSRVRHTASVEVTVEKLNQLDAQRREIESRLPPNLLPSTPDQNRQ